MTFSVSFDLSEDCKINSENDIYVAGNCLH